LLDDLENYVSDIKRRKNILSEGKTLFVKNNGCEITITRIFNATRDLVWKTWTEPERIKRWWGPKDFTSTVCNIDLRVGGVLLFCMRSPEGRDFWSTGIFREIVDHSLIVCTDSFADERGNIVPASHYGMNSDFPLEMLWTITFEDFKGNTKFTLMHSGLPIGEMADLTNQGWNESMDKFAETLKYSLPRNNQPNNKSSLSNRI
jgi:uncharacterized protein YndB with AHSA1/START domain